MKLEEALRETKSRRFRFGFELLFVAIRQGQTTFFQIPLLSRAGRAVRPRLLIFRKH